MRTIYRAMALLLMFAVSIGGVSAADTRKPQPGGFTLGMTKAEIVATGAVIEEVTEEPVGTVIWVSSMPKEIADFSYAALNMGFDDRLAQVSIFSREEPNDQYGFWIREKVSNVIKILNQLYGNGEIMLSDLDPYMDRPHDFAFALEREAITVAGGWKAKGTTIYLRGEAQKGATKYVLRYSDDELVRNLKAEMEKRDSSAL